MSAMAQQRTHAHAFKLRFDKLKQHHADSRDSSGCTCPFAAVRCAALPYRVFSTSSWKLGQTFP